MLKINGLTKIYGRGGVKAVDDLTLEVKQGEIFGFIGPNGAGKSTTIKCLTGIIPFDRGQIGINGHDLLSDSIAAKQSVGYVSDSHIIYDNLTGAEYAAFMAGIYGMTDAAEIQRRTDFYAQIFELTGNMDSPIKSYSHGMKQKINVIGAIIHEPQLLVLDEPLTGLDPKSAFKLKQLMRAHCDKGNTVFFSSHVLDVVEKVCDRVGIISKGRLVAVGTVDELKRMRDDASLEEYFLSVTAESDVAASAEDNLL